MFQNYIPLNKSKTIKYSNDEIKIKTKKYSTSFI